jgi:hypothetical protein
MQSTLHLAQVRCLVLKRPRPLARRLKRCSEIGLFRGHTANPHCCIHFTLGTSNGFATLFGTNKNSFRGLMATQTVPPSIPGKWWCESGGDSGLFSTKAGWLRGVVNRFAVTFPTPQFARYEIFFPCVSQRNEVIANAKRDFCGISPAKGSPIRILPTPSPRIGHGAG